MPGGDAVTAQRRETILVERAGGVVVVTLNRPERKNAANGTMWRELRETWAEVEGRSDDRVLVLTGAGGEFCSGADLGDPGGATGGPGEPPLARMRSIGETVLGLHRLTVPTIAKVRGVAAGAGLSLALACDLAVGSTSARVSMIFSRRGLTVDGGASWLLPRLVGLHRAKELAFFADIVSAPDAHAMGLLNRVVPDEELDTAVGEWAHRLAAGPPLALSMTKRLLNDSMAASMESALEREATAQCTNFATADTAEALTAFMERREPTFGGR